MKVQITCPVPEADLQAGLIYDLPTEQAQELIAREMAIAVEDEQPADEPKKGKRS